MARFTVNGTPVSAPDDAPLMPFLREQLGLTSVKNGCSEGVCGTCTILLDGRAVRACTLTGRKVEGKHILTCEGLTIREQAVYGYAFAQAGAVQCGFCTPGMVMAAKGLLDAVPDPTRAQIQKALRGNLCRCTGYKKIIDAVELAGHFLRTGEEVPAPVFTGQIGENMHRVDAIAKALGTAQYVDDMRLEGMVHGSALRAAHPRARVVSIDTAAARALPGVRAVLTAADIPGEGIIGHLKHDWPVLIAEGELTHTLGDAVALVAADDRDTLARAKELIQVEYEVLPAVFSPAQALAPGAPLVHPEGNLLSKEHLVRGDAEGAIARSKYVVTRTYTTPASEHAFLEPECAVARKEADGSVTIFSADQGIYQTRRECAAMLGLPEELVRVVAKSVGGGFGGKEDMSVQHHAALLAWYLDVPVKVALTRQESLLIHPKRHPMEMTITTACDEQGNLTAMRATLVADTGAYASLGGPVLQRACTHAAGPYHYQNVDITGIAVYTNNPPSGAFRGFGVTQSCFAAECNLNLLAQQVGLSPWEFRYRNAIRPGEVLPNGQVAGPDTALVETLEAVKPYFDANPKAGLACAMKNAGLGVGVPDTGRVKLHVEQGLVHVRTSAACIGQGIGTVLVQMVCQTAGLTPERVVWDAPDTATCPDSGNTTASRQTLFTGEAARRASVELRRALEGASLAELDGADFFGEYTGVTDKMGCDKEHPVSHIAYSFATHLVELDEQSGKVSRVVAAHDVGRAVNPRNVEGQVEGGVVMSLGWALTERFPLAEGRPTARLGTLGILRADNVPEVVPILIEKPESELACGAKGIGELCSIPTAPAVQLAYYNRDGVFRTDLPLENTPYQK